MTTRPTHVRSRSVPHETEAENKTNYGDKWSRDHAGQSQSTLVHAWCTCGL